MTAETELEYWKRVAYLAVCSLMNQTERIYELTNISVYDAEEHAEADTADMCDITVSEVLSIERKDFDDAYEESEQ